jgi:hypothetical protein
MVNSSFQISFQELSIPQIALENPVAGGTMRGIDSVTKKDLCLSWIDKGLNYYSIPGRQG